MLGDAQTGALMSTAQIAAIQRAIDRAAALHPGFEQAQREFVALSLGDVSPEAARRAAAIVMEAARL